MTIAQETLSRDAPPSVHPLEIIPFFRRYRCTWWRDAIYTLIWDTLIALCLTGVIAVVNPAADLSRWLWTNWVIANCIGYLIHLGFALGQRLARDWLRGRSFAGRMVFFAGIPIAGVFAGYWLGLELLNLPDVRSGVFSLQGAVSISIISLVISSILAVVFFSRERAAKLEAALLREQSRAIVFDKAAVDARFRMLQAQIEPHFLFNTLANVVSLIDPAPAKARQMLEDFIDYLRASLSANRAELLTLGDEIDLVHAYLRLIALRMGDRLRCRFDVAPATLQLPFPPLLLQPLVENAVIHGLEPKIEGGEIRISAEATSDWLTISVIDDGLGLATPIREGVGLSNVRERLRALYGDRTGFQLANSAPGGTRVTITIPRNATSN